MCKQIEVPFVAPMFLFRRVTVTISLFLYDVFGQEDEPDQQEDPNAQIAAKEADPELKKKQDEEKDALLAKLSDFKVRLLLLLPLHVAVLCARTRGFLSFRSVGFFFSLPAVSFVSYSCLQVPIPSLGLFFLLSIAFP